MSIAIPAASSRSLGGFIGGVIGAVGGFVTGGPGGAVAGAQAGSKIGDALTGGGGGPPANPLPGKPLAFGPDTGTGATSSGSTNPAGGCPTGVKKCNPCAVYGLNKHPNTHTLQASKKHGVQPPGTYCVTRRHMNPLNIRALRRADRRAHSFLKISRRVIKHYVAKQPKGRSYIHTRRKSR